MIIGVGVDMVDVHRLEAAISRRGEDFLRRVFTDGEISYCQKKKTTSGQAFAARFAAKEALFKALGTGWRGGLRWTDVEVVREESGKPSLQLQGVAKQKADDLLVRAIHVSLSDLPDKAVAVVILQ